MRIPLIKLVAIGLIPASLLDPIGVQAFQAVPVVSIDQLSRFQEQAIEAYLITVKSIVARPGEVHNTVERFLTPEITGGAALEAEVSLHAAEIKQKLEKSLEILRIQAERGNNLEQIIPLRIHVSQLMQELKRFLSKLPSVPPVRFAFSTEGSEQQLDYGIRDWAFNNMGLPYSAEQAARSNKNELKHISALLTTRVESSEHLMTRLNILSHLPPEAMVPVDLENDSIITISIDKPFPLQNFPARVAEALENQRVAYGHEIPYNGTVWIGGSDKSGFLRVVWNNQLFRLDLAKGKLLTPDRNSIPSGTLRAKALSPNLLRFGAATQSIEVKTTDLFSIGIPVQLHVDMEHVMDLLNIHLKFITTDGAVYISAPILVGQWKHLENQEQELVIPVVKMVAQPRKKLESFSGLGVLSTILTSVEKNTPSSLSIRMKDVTGQTLEQLDRHLAKLLSENPWAQLIPPRLRDSLTMHDLEWIGIREQIGQESYDTLIKAVEVELANTELGRAMSNAGFSRLSFDVNSLEGGSQIDIIGRRPANDSGGVLTPNDPKPGRPLRTAKRSASVRGRPSINKFTPPPDEPVQPEHPKLGSHAALTSKEINKLRKTVLTNNYEDAHKALWELSRNKTPKAAKLLCQLASNKTLTEPIQRSLVEHLEFVNREWISEQCPNGRKDNVNSALKLLQRRLSPPLESLNSLYLRLSEEEFTNRLKSRFQEGLPISLPDYADLGRWLQKHGILQWSYGSGNSQKSVRAELRLDPESKMAYRIEVYPEIDSPWWKAFVKRSEENEGIFSPGSIGHIVVYPYAFADGTFAMLIKTIQPSTEFRSLDIKNKLRLEPWAKETVDKFIEWASSYGYIVIASNAIVMKQLSPELSATELNRYYRNSRDQRLWVMHRMILSPHARPLPWSIFLGAMKRAHLSNELGEKIRKLMRPVESPQQAFPNKSA